MKWTADQISWCGSLFLIGLLPGGIALIAVCLLCYLVSEILERKASLPEIDRPVTTTRTGYRITGNISTYGDIGSRSNRAIWRDFFDNDNF